MSIVYKCSRSGSGGWTRVAPQRLAGEASKIEQIAGGTATAGMSVLTLANKNENYIDGTISGALTYGDSASIIGTFTADGASQTIRQTFSNQGAINGYVLRAVPEPGTYALLSGLLALGCVMVRRRR